jgi:phosphoadenylylsulfate reductase (thioredoxin) (EC 1.8.4.8)
MDIMLKINPKFRFFTLDTGRLPQETYDIMDIVRKNIIFRLKYYFLILEKLKKWLMKKE